jgi:hypothetical protein
MGAVQPGRDFEPLRVRAGGAALTPRPAQEAPGRSEAALSSEPGSLGPGALFFLTARRGRAPDSYDKFGTHGRSVSVRAELVSVCFGEQQLDQRVRRRL